MPIVMSDSLVVGSDTLDYQVNNFRDDPSTAISLILPALLVFVALIAFMIDFGTIGVVLGSMCGIATLQLIGLVALNVSSVISYIILGAIFIYKLRN